MKRAVFMMIGAAVLAAAAISGCSRNNALDALELSGNVEATEVDLGFESGGRVTSIKTEEGAPVKTGDLVAALDDAEISIEMEKGKAAVIEAEVRLKELRAGARPQEIKEAQAGVQGTKAELEKAEKDLRRAETLYSNGAIPASSYDAAKKTLETAKAAYAAAREKASLVKEGPRKEEIRAAESRLAQNRAALASIVERLKERAIYSPIDGVVLSRNVEPGEVVQPGTPVVTIGELKEPWVKVYIKEDRLGLVKLGQDAEVTTDSYPGKKYKGKVTYISSEAEFTPKTVQTKEERVKLVFGAKVKVENPEGELKPGMPADVRIFLK